MNRYIHSIYSGFKRSLCYYFDTSAIPDKHLQRFLRQNVFINYSNSVIVSISAILFSAVKIILHLAMYGLGHASEKITLLAVFAGVLFLFLSISLFLKSFYFTNAKLASIVTYLGYVTCMSWVLFIVMSYNSVYHSITLYVVALFVFALFTYYPIVPATLFFAFSQIAFLVLLYFFETRIEVLSNCYYISTIAVVFAWLGSRIAYRMREDSFKTRIEGEDLEHMSMTDPLLNIPNRRKFDLSLDAAWRYCERDGQPLALAIIDVDDFKSYNDMYGHLEGDQCLRKVSRTLSRSIVRKSDSFMRVGGEEFAVIMPFTDINGAKIVCNRLRNAVEAIGIPSVDSKSGIVTISIGVASVLPGIDSSILFKEDLFNAADTALYHAKKSGKNAVAS